MPKTLIKIDLSQSPYKNEAIHNRWHPDIPIIAWVKPGDDFFAFAQLRLIVFEQFGDDCIVVVWAIAVWTFFRASLFQFCAASFRVPGEAL